MGCFGLESGTAIPIRKMTKLRRPAFPVDRWRSYADINPSAKNLTGINPVAAAVDTAMNMDGVNPDSDDLPIPRPASKALDGKQADKYTALWCPGRSIRPHGAVGDADSRGGFVASHEAHRQVRNGPTDPADGQASIHGSFSPPVKKSQAGGYFLREPPIIQQGGRIDAVVRSKWGQFMRIPEKRWRIGV